MKNSELLNSALSSLTPDSVVVVAKMAGFWTKKDWQDIYQGIQDDLETALLGNITHLSVYYIYHTYHLNQSRLRDWRSSAVFGQQPICRLRPNRGHQDRAVCRFGGRLWRKGRRPGRSQHSNDQSRDHRRVHLRGEQSLLLLYV